MEKRLIIALALSMLVLFVFQATHKPAPKTFLRQPAAAQYVRSTESATGAKAQSPAIKQEDLVEEEVIINTDKLVLVFSDIGGTLKKISLKEYEDKGTEEVLYEEADAAERLFAMDLPGYSGMEMRKFETFQGEGYIEFKHTEQGAVEIIKRYTIPKSFDHLSLDITIKNLSQKESDLSYVLVAASGPKIIDAAGRRFLQANAMIDGKIWREKPGNKAKEKTGDIKWVGIKNQYFAIALNPGVSPGAITVQTTSGQDLIAMLSSPRHSLVPGSKATDDFVFYAGPLDEKRINVLGEEATQMVDFGFFGGVSKALLGVMRVFYGWTKNWGISIILLTLAINILLFPLTLKSFVSMQQMKKIQPHVEKLKELHKDNPQKLNKEMMELYKKYNVNPLGGCLPLLLQMPIFIALYQALVNTIDLKGGKFLWIHDLSRPDAVPLPVSAPFIGKSINILPILMAIGMFVQQKLSQGAAGALTDEQANQQKIMMIMFPLLFGFMFYNMPSGLVLYWLTNTVLMTTEQGLISKRIR